MKKLNEFTVTTIVVAISILICFVTTELIARKFLLPSSKSIHNSEKKQSEFKNHWPSLFNPDIGFTFKPNSTVRLTNGLDFAVEQKANSLGFLDYERVKEKPDDLYRILVIGDSYVEAAQVAIEEKFHVILEKKLNEWSVKRPYEVMALGYSGCGTSNELSFYEEIGIHFDPDLVIILFVSNDFANNSSILEALRNGWHPYHPPRLFFEKNGENGFKRITIEPDWKKHLIDADIVLQLRFFQAHYLL